MADERPQIPPPRFAVREFTTPNPSDGFYTEVFKRLDPAYMAIEVPKRGTLYSSIQGAKPDVIALFPNLYFLKESRYGSSHEFVIWTWASDPTAQDTYNPEVVYADNQLLFPTFRRPYTIRRDEWDANQTPVAMLTPLSRLVAVEVPVGGSGYSTHTAISFSGGGGSGAKAIPIIAAGVIISAIVTVSGSGYTSAPTVSITDTGGGTGAVAQAFLQPQSALLVNQVKQEFPDDSPFRNEYVRVLREYRTLPGPVIQQVRVLPESGVPILSCRQERAATDTFTQLGDYLPAALTVSVVTTGASPSVQLQVGSVIDLPIGAWVIFSGTSSSPSINGTPYQITSLSIGPSGLGQVFTIAVPSPITAGGMGGTVQSVNWISRQLLETDNGNVKNKEDTMLAVASMPTEVIDTYFNYPYPNFIEAFNFWTSISFSTDITTGPGFLTSNSVDGSVSTPEQAGFRGQSTARRQRFFFSGPPTRAFRDTYPPTKIIPSLGQVIIRGFAQAGSTFPGGASGQSFSQSFHFHEQNFGPALTGPNPQIFNEPVPGQLGPFTISSVDITTPNIPKITLTAAHGMATTNGSVTITGSTTTPLIDGTWTVVAIPSTTSFQIQTPFSLTAAGPGGGQVNVGGVATAVLDMPVSTPPMMVSNLSIASISTSATPTITTTGGVTSGKHYLQVGQYVYLDNTNTSPSLDKQYWKVATTPTATTFTIAPGLGTITGSTSHGTMQEELTVAEEPRRLGTGAMWEVPIRLVDVAYTSGQSS